MKKLNINKKYIVVSVILVIFLLVFFIFININESNNTNEEINEDIITYNDKEYELNDNVVSIVLIGVDKYLDEEVGYYVNNAQADFILDVVLDLDNNTTSLLLLNRDSMCNFNLIDSDGYVYGSTYGQLALSHTYGDGSKISAKNTRDAVSGILNDVNITYFACVSLDGIAIVNDSLGGIEIDNELLLGEDCVAYLRARKDLDIPTNVERMNRHIVYLNKLQDKLINKIKEDPSYGEDIIFDLIEYLDTNMSVERISSLMDFVENSNINEIITLDGDFKYSENVEFYPFESSITETVLKLYYKEK